MRFVDQSFCRIQFLCANRIRCLPASIRCWIEVTLSVWVFDRITPAFSHTVGKETTNPNATRRSKQKLNKVGPLIPVKQKQHLNVLPLCWMHTRERTRKLQEYCLVHTAAYASTTSTTRVQRRVPQRHRVWSSYASALLRLHRTSSTSTSPCIATTRRPAAQALRQPRRAPRVLISQAQRLYIDYVVRHRDVVFWAYDYFDYSSRLVN
jgi:hypothetical protein